MSSRNRGWQKLWDVDPEDSSATHRPSGVMFSFDWDRNDKMTCAIVEDPRTLLYVQEKKRTLSERDFAGHMRKLEKQAIEIFTTKLVD